MVVEEPVVPDMSLIEYLLFLLLTALDRVHRISPDRSVYIVVAEFLRVLVLTRIKKRYQSSIGEED